MGFIGSHPGKKNIAYLLKTIPNISNLITMHKCKIDNFHFMAGSQEPMGNVQNCFLLVASFRIKRTIKKNIKKHTRFCI